MIEFAMWMRALVYVFLVLGMVAGFAGCQSGGPWGRQQDFSKATLTNEQADQLVRRESPGSFRWSNDYSLVLERASREQKPMMLLFTGSDWCSYCTKIEKEVFSQPEFVSWADEKFIPMIVDFPRSKRLASDIAGQNEQLKDRFSRYVEGYPTVLFVQPDGQVIGKMGYERGGAKNWIASADLQVAPALKPSAERMALEPASTRTQ
jgi:protein disulfide-isomerase